MKYTPTDVGGVMIVDIEPERDDRGFQTRLFCAEEFAEYGLLSAVAQTHLAYNYARGRCAASTARFRRMPRPSWSAAPEAPSSPWPSMCVRSRATTATM